MDALVEQSIRALQKHVKKTPLQAKLLSKPPFRFLHDLISEVLSATGYAQGLFTDLEMNSENVKEKDAKIAYLTKIIQCVSWSLNEAIDAKPGKIVAGLEPEKTNIFLQKLAQAASSGRGNSASAVQKVLTGQQFGSGAATTSGPPPKQAAPTPAPTAKAAPVQQPSSSSVPQAQPQQKQQQQPSAPAKQGQPAVSKATKKSHESLNQSRGAINNNKDSSREELAKSSHNVFTDEPAQPAAEKPGAVVVAPAPADSLKKTLARPMSARPPPPRTKKPDAIVDDVSTASNVQPTVFVETPAGKDKTNKTQEDDDETFIIVNPVTSQQAGEQVHGSSEPTQHGGLVRKILETKRELEGSKATREEEERLIQQGVSGDRAKLRVATQKEVTELRDAIQGLVRSTDPLAKTMDYVQEDLDSMQKELDQWRKESAKHRKRLEEEIRITEEALKPVEAQLKQIESAIQDQLEKITSSKSSIIQNELAIEKLLSSH